MTLDAYLEQFSEPDGYLDFASNGPPSQAVVDAVTEAIHWLAAPGVPSPFEAAIRDARARGAGLLGTSPEHVVLIPSTSAGLFAVAFGLPRGPVVVRKEDFPANAYPWLRAAVDGRISLVPVEAPDGRVDAARVAPLVDSSTVAVAVSLVDYLTGYRVDLGELREACGDALLVVDAAQGLGAVGVALAEADVVVSTGAKWLRGGLGVGLAGFSDRALERLAPTLTGWTGVEGFLDFETPVPHRPRADAQRFQQGSAPAFMACALAAALEVIDLAGMDAISRLVVERAAGVEEGLRRAGAEVLAPWRSPRERAGIVSFRMPHEALDRTAGRLAAGGLVVSRRAGLLRVSVHATSRAEVGERLHEVLRR